MIALVIGHNSRSKGAYSPYLKTTEYEYWKKVTEKIREKIEVDIFERKSSISYIQEMKEVISKINKKNYDFILELHFNSANNSSVQGVEVLRHTSSIKGAKIGELFTEKINQEFGVVKRNEIIIKSSNQRGGYGICKTKSPYILIEPFFASNEKAIEFSVDRMSKFLIDFLKEMRECGI